MSSLTAMKATLVLLLTAFSWKTIHTPFSKAWLFVDTPLGHKKESCTSVPNILARWSG